MDRPAGGVPWNGHPGPGPRRDPSFLGLVRRTGLPLPDGREYRTATLRPGAHALLPGTDQGLRRLLPRAHRLGQRLVIPIAPLVAQLLGQTARHVGDPIVA